MKGKRIKTRKTVKIRPFKATDEKRVKRIIKKPVQSTQQNLPIREIADGIIITRDNRYVQLIEIEPSNFQMATEDTQNAIISAFEAFLRISPNNLQIKCITQPADMSLQLNRIAQDMLTETNDNCYELETEQIERFKHMRTQSVSRRFFIAFEYEKRSLFKKPYFMDVQSDLKSTRDQMIAYLNACGNKAIIAEDETEQVGEILYTILNRKESEKSSFTERAAEVYTRYVQSGKYAPDRIPYIPPTDFIAPYRIDLQSADYISIDGKYYSFCYIPSKGYNPQVIAGWANTFINLGDGIDLDIFLSRQPKEQMLAQIRRSIKYNNMSAIGAGETQDATFRLEEALESGEYLLSGLQGYEDFYYLSMLITVTGDTPDIVEDRVRELEKLALAKNLSIHVCRFEQEDAFISSLPLCKLSENLFNKAKRNVLTSGAASVYPFMSYELNDPNGILWGVQTSNQSPVVIDMFDHTKYVAANAFITGVTGAGKSSLLKALALRMRMRHIPAYIIVPEKQDEFRRLCSAVGGQFIELGAGSPTRINILEIFKRDETVTELLDDYMAESSLLAAKVQDLKTFFQLLIPDISYEEKQLMDEALMRTYRKKGITEDNESLIDPENPKQFKKDMPIMGDLLETLMEMGLQRLSNIIRMLVTGSGSSFNGLTNIDLSNGFIVIGLEKTNEELLPASMFLAIDFLFSKIKEDKSKQKVLFVEEVWKLMLNPSAASRILEIAKIIRAYGGSLILATQQLRDITMLDGGKYGEGIINSCSFKIILKHNESDMDMLANTMKLSAREAGSISGFARGTGLVIAGNNSVIVDFTLSPKEYDLITTDPRDLAARKKARLKSRQQAIKRTLSNEMKIENLSDLKLTEFQLHNQPVSDNKTLDMIDFQLDEC